jgi:hypothetical protein
MLASATLAVVTAPAAMSAAMIESSGNPPALMPVIVPEPEMVIGMALSYLK